MRVGYFGPEGTFTHEAALHALANGAGDDDLVPLATIHDTVMAVRDGDVVRAIVPIENSIEGSVNATLDTLALQAPEVSILGELVLPISQCLITRSAVDLEQIVVVASHPQATGQCRDYLRTRLPHAAVHAASSTAEAVRLVAGGDGRSAALGTRLAAELYGCRVLEADVQDSPDNETRFVWLGPAGSPPGLGFTSARGAPFKTAIVFWGAGAEASGWLVGCLAELADRQVNLTRIESRPRKQTLGRYMFFVDLEGAVSDPAIVGALAGLRRRVEELRILGSFPVA